MAGVFLLSSGSAAINHIEEATTDLQMDRTRNRPLPAGTITRWQAWLFAILLIGAGLLLMLQLNSAIPAILGVGNIFLYNGLYTPLKRVTAFAAIPGALIGAIPPLIGWTAADGQLTHYHAILLAFLFFIGQIPHFWLILLINTNDYERAGFPTLRRHFSEQQIARLTLFWILATAMSALMLVLFGIISSLAISLLVLTTILYLLYSFRSWFRIGSVPDPRRAFISLNIFYLLMMTLLIADAIGR